MPSVEETVQRARRGDAAAFAELITRFERTALAVAFGVLADGDRAGEAVQEAFVRAWERLEDLREPERFGPWLCGIVRNLARDAQRRAGREFRARSSVPAVLYASRADDPVARLEDCENEERLAAALGKLDETARMAVVLRYYEGMTSKQIGSLLDMSSTAIDMRLMRARQALRRELTGDEPRQA
ncbi:MAG TPA: sigma-70 family RNA polymerase sigma factor [Pirellulales bacterium]|nr:sigma-70 family RNA polymerase sigma factor [Pirellulales bacterium]